MLRRTMSVAGAAALVVTLGPVTQQAQAAPTAATAACSLKLGSWNQDWGHSSRVITATNPITVSPVLSTPHLYQPPYAVGPGSTFTAVPKPGGRTTRTGKIIGAGGGVTEHSYTILPNGQRDPAAPVVMRKIGRGWNIARFLEQSAYTAPGATKPSRTMLYHSDQNGRFYRYTAVGSGWSRAGDVRGLSAMKSFTLIGRGANYDTFLANNRGGGLYTIRIPTTMPLKPVVTTVRATTWQGFSQLIATPCGKQGTLLLGITGKSGYLYALSHANGTKTVIKSLGKVPGEFTDYSYFRFAPSYDPLTGA